MGRLKVWFWIAVAATLAEIVLAIITMQRLGTLKRLFLSALASPTDQAIAAVDRAGAAVDALNWPSVVIFILGFVTIIGWMHSGAKAVFDGDLGLLRHSTGWAIGAWFVPVLNLVRVPQIAADLYRVGRTSPRAGLIIGGWWFLWLIDGFSARAAMSAPEPQTPEAVAPALDLLSASYWVTIASGAATITMLAMVTAGLGGAAARPRAPIAPAGAPAPSLWGPPVGAPDPRFGQPAPDPRFEQAAPDPRFGIPAPPPAAPSFPAAPPSGPPVPVAAPPAAAPAAPPAPAPAAPPPAPPGAPAPAPSPYPPTQTFFPE